MNQLHDAQLKDEGGCTVRVDRLYRADESDDWLLPIGRAVGHYSKKRQPRAAAAVRRVLMC